MRYDLTRVLSSREAKRLVRQAGHPARIPSQPGPWANRWRGLVEKHVPQPAQLVTPSRWLAGLARQAPWFEGIPVDVIPYGVTLLNEPAAEMPRHEARRRWGVPGDRPCLLLIAANLRSPYKGMHLAVDTLAHLVRILPVELHPTLLLMGRRSDALAETLRARTGLNIIQDYASTHPDLAAAYRAADLTLVPSVADNFPYTVIESLACATPVASFAVGGIPEAVAPRAEVSHGLLSQPFETENLAQQIASWLQRSESPGPFAVAARRWAEAQCGMDHFVEALQRAYVELASVATGK